MSGIDLHRIPPSCSTACQPSNHLNRARSSFVRQREEGRPVANAVRDGLDQDNGGELERGGRRWEVVREKANG
jgi:hypothetical protein